MGLICFKYGVSCDRRNLIWEVGANYVPGKDNYIHCIQPMNDSSAQILVDLINVHQFTQEWERQLVANGYTKPFDQFKLHRVPCTVLECTFMDKCCFSSALTSVMVSL